MKNCITLLQEKLHKYQHYHQVNKYEYLTGEKIFPLDQSRIIERAKFTDSHLGNALKDKQKQLKIKKENKWMLSWIKTTEKQL